MKTLFPYYQKNDLYLITVAYYSKVRTCVKNTLYKNTLANKKAIKLQAERKEPSSAQHWELQSLPQMDGTVFGTLPASEQIVRGGGLEER